MITCIDGAFCFTDTGERRIPQPGEYYFIIGSSNDMPYRAISDPGGPPQVFTLDPSKYGIYNMEPYAKTSQTAAHPEAVATIGRNNQTSGHGAEQVKEAESLDALFSRPPFPVVK